MQVTSQTYKDIFLYHSYFTETCIYVGLSDEPVDSDADEFVNSHQDFVCGEEDLISIRTSRNTFSEGHPMIGCCTCAEIDLEMFEPSFTIERMAKIEVFIRLVSTDSDDASEWIRKGVFFVDTRSTTENRDDMPVLTIHGYDAMRKSETEYGDSTLEFPVRAITLVRDIASKMGVELDSRCVSYIDASTQVPYPAQYTMREMLGYIASIFAGNWIINEMGQLQFIPLYGLPKETGLLIDRAGERIVFGESPEEQVRIDIYGSDDE